MELSVIIVNYNVEQFLEQCLNSVKKATREIEAEVFVVDNNSIDGSVAMVKAKFPSVHLIENKQNTGFSKANNQALAKAKGKYVLLLNPDTIVQEDTFAKVIQFMNEHPDAGGLGVQMIDGKGNFLPESKRGLPTPWVAFYKIFGLSRLFPRSRKFGRYHLGYLSNNETHEIEILSGAFMLMRKEALDKVGMLDEDFFMYGEDIDLSYRIIKGGYKNYYYPHTNIVHYKGESTKKSSVNYVFVFYNAMVIFARKHFSAKNARAFSFLINMAIYLRAAIAVGNRFIKKSIIPLVDLAAICALLFTAEHWYSQLSGKFFEWELIRIALPIYTLVWACTVLLAGGYDKPIKLLKLVKGVLIGTGIILIGYSLLPENLRFSRLLILAGGATTFCYFMASRFLLHITGIQGYQIGGKKNLRIAIIGSENEAERVSNLLAQTTKNPNVIGFISAEEEGTSNTYIGNLSQVSQVIDIHKVEELIFCAKDLSSQQIIDVMSKPEKGNIEFKIAQPESLYLIGSSSIETSGDLYMLDINAISKPANRRNKRLFDVVSSFILLSVFPVVWIINKGNPRFMWRLIQVLFGARTMVGYSTSKTPFGLPKIKEGVLKTTDKLQSPAIGNDVAEKLDIVYARNYRTLTDMQTLFRGLTKLSN